MDVVSFKALGLKKNFIDSTVRIITTILVVVFNLFVQIEKAISEKEVLILETKEDVLSVFLVGLIILFLENFTENCTDIVVELGIFV